MPRFDKFQRLSLLLSELRQYEKICKNLLKMSHLLYNEFTFTNVQKNLKKFSSNILNTYSQNAQGRSRLIFMSVFSQIYLCFTRYHAREIYVRSTCVCKKPREKINFIYLLSHETKRKKFFLFLYLLENSWRQQKFFIRGPHLEKKQ